MIFFQLSYFYINNYLRSKIISYIYRIGCQKILSNNKTKSKHCLFLLDIRIFIVNIYKFQQTPKSLLNVFKLKTKDLYLYVVKNS